MALHIFAFCLGNSEVPSLYKEHAVDWLAALGWMNRSLLSLVSALEIELAVIWALSI
jgi:hypothetical protein